MIRCSNTGKMITFVSITTGAEISLSDELAFMVLKIKKKNTKTQTKIKTKFVIKHNNN